MFKFSSKMVLILVSVIVLIASGYFGVNYYRNQQLALHPVDTPDPRGTLPLAVVRTPELQANFGKFYRTSILITQDGINEKLEVAVTGLPKGLIFRGCEFEYDTKFTSTIPNTLAKCEVSGIPQERGSFDLEVTATVVDAPSESITNIKLIVI